MTSIDVLRKALEALEAMEGIGALEDGTLGDHGGIPTAQKKCRRAITALRAELERMEAVEPVATRTGTPAKQPSGSPST